MNLASAVVVYVILWWVTFFCVLPIGIRPAGEAQLGHDAGAPANPNLAKKAIATTLIAFALFGVAYWIIVHDWISFRHALKLR